MSDGLRDVGYLLIYYTQSFSLHRALMLVRNLFSGVPDDDYGHAQNPFPPVATPTHPIPPHANDDDHDDDDAHISPLLLGAGAFFEALFCNTPSITNYCT